MSEEEKKAIKWLKELYDIEKDFNSSVGKEESNIIKTLLNLIEKQQKEIEENKETINALKPNLEELIEMSNFAMQKDYISKDKIREKIKAVSNGVYDAKLILKDLLEENNND